MFQEAKSDQGDKPTGARLKATNPLNIDPPSASSTCITDQSPRESLISSVQDLLSEIERMSLNDQDKTSEVRSRNTRLMRVTDDIANIREDLRMILENLQQVQHQVRMNNLNDCSQRIGQLLCELTRLTDVKKNLLYQLKRP